MRLSKLVVLQLLVCTVVASEAADVVAAATNPSADIFVSPLGNDANLGTEQQPFLTLERARDAVRNLKKHQPDRDYTISIRGGTYRLKQTIVFSTDDSATVGHTITYAAYPGEIPLFTSGLLITGWQQVQKPLPGQTDAANGKLWAASVPDELRDFSMLFDGEKRLPRARGQGYTALARSACKDKAHGSHLLLQHFPPGAVPPWSLGRNWELVTVPEHFWVMNILPITNIDNAKHILQTDVPATYSMVNPHFGQLSNGSSWIENAIECLDEPGEWIFDAAARKIYLWPLNNRASDNIVAPLLTEYIRIEGEVTDARTGDIPVRGLVFRGLTFTHGDRSKWQPDKTGLGLQHDWEMFDRPTAMMRLRGAENCLIEGCRFVNSGGTAIRLDLYAQNNTIHGNLISHIGGAGVLLAGYGPGLKDVNRNNEVSGNHIHHVGESLWHSVGVFAWQSGKNRIAGNLIHHCPYTAIVVSGRIVWDRNGNAECSRTIRWDDIEESLRTSNNEIPWNQREKYLHSRNNIVEGNEVFQVMQTLGDGNCIYISGAGEGNIVRSNYLHDVTSSNMNAAIRCDDDQHGTITTGNLVWRTCGEGYISKGNNTFTNNVIADIRSCFKEQNKFSRGFLVHPSGDVTGSLIQHNIFYCTNADMNLLYEGKGKPSKSTPVTALRVCKADNNIYFCTKNPRWAVLHLSTQCGYGVECNSIEADPLFVDPDNGNFQLQPDSPALRLGFQPLAVKPIDRIVFPFNE